MAYLIGRLSWFGYLVTVATLIPAILFTIALPLVFALIMIMTKKAIININSWYTVFVFPVFFTAFELLLIKFSPDGTAASIAYSQSDFLPLVQIASITGILGVTFMITLVPSALAIGWHFRKEKIKFILVCTVTLTFLLSSFIFGMARLMDGSERKTIIAGLIVLDEKSHKMENLDFQYELQHTINYAKKISEVAIQGAKLIVLPERAINIHKETDSAAVAILGDVAKQHQVTIVVGYTNYKSGILRNSAMVIDEEGNVSIDYNKSHLVKGLEDQFSPGGEIGLFEFENENTGIAICKDLDFPQYIRQYGKSQVNILCVPAWDFVVDDWLHSRMAIMRGVESGFSEIRSARLGRLTISDSYGRVNAEANCASGKSTIVIGSVSVNDIETPYSMYGDWFGVVTAISALLFIILIAIKMSKLV
tara:strand:- start:13659 stop:14921 length:1263 start_codon:yes stop_codon:yes gene_type:complete